VDIQLLTQAEIEELARTPMVQPLPLSQGGLSVVGTGIFASELYRRMLVEMWDGD
jgi:hypothetical protein